MRVILRKTPLKVYSILNPFLPKKQALVLHNSEFQNLDQ